MSQYTYLDEPSLHSTAHYIVKRDNQADIEFSGKRVGQSSTSDVPSDKYYSGKPGVRTELNLYQTEKKKCEQIEHTCWQGSSNRYTAKVCTTYEEVIRFFAYSNVAKRLFNSAGISTTQKIA